jgi:hypothetical protein
MTHPASTSEDVHSPIITEFLKVERQLLREIKGANTARGSKQKNY